MARRVYLGLALSLTTVTLPIFAQCRFPPDGTGRILNYTFDPTPAATGTVLHVSLKFRDGQAIEELEVPTGWAGETPINDFFKARRQGTAFGQQLLAKYLGSTYMLKQAVSESGMKRFQETAETFRKFSSQYNVDYLLMMAEGYQESGLNQNARSPVGAIGVMQLMPDTGKQMNVGDITQETANIHAGIKYFRSMVDKLYANEPIDDLNKVLFTFASYNCGPNRVKQLRAEAAQKGLDPSVWINNVEVIAAARLGVETVTYVSNIYKYYVAYKLIAAQEEQSQKAKESIR